MDVDILERYKWSDVCIINLIFSVVLSVQEKCVQWLDPHKTQFPPQFSTYRNATDTYYVWRRFSFWYRVREQRHKL